MGWKTLVLCLGVVAIAAGCNDEVEFSCDDPKYGNGTCDLDTTCGAPDIDCYTTFDTPEAAKAWYEASGLVAARGPALSSTDTRFASTQALIDEGWELYKSLHTLGELADKRPQLVLVENSAVNAFVYAMDGIPGLAIMVNTALVDSAGTKSQKLGIMMHEFEHAVGLHGNSTVRNALRKYYATPADSELIGHRQAENPAVRAIYESWLQYEQLVGFASDVELGGLPFTPSKINRDTIEAWGIMGVLFGKLIEDRRVVVNTAACNNAVTQFKTLHAAAITSTSPLDLNFSVSPTGTMNIVTTITGLRDQCFVGVTGDAIAHMATVAGDTEAEVRAKMPDDIEAIIAGKTVITGWYQAVQLGRQRMREIEASYMTMFGAPWSRLRIYTTEEAADDSSAQLMVALGLDADGAGQLLVNETTGLGDLCNPLLAAGSQLPYGQNLPDDHHATCWRVGHQRAVGIDPGQMEMQRWTPIHDAPPPLVGGVIME